METEDKIKLQRALELSEENNKMLKSLVRGMRWAKLLRVIYLVVIIGSAIGAFYLIEPYLKEAATSYGSIKDSINNFSNSLSMPR